MRIGSVVAVLAVVLAVSGCDSGPTTGTPVTGDGAPDGQGGTVALEFRQVLEAVPSGAADGPEPGSDPRETRQSADPEVQRAALAALDCAGDPLRGAVVDAARPLVACAADGTEKFVLAPTTLTGEDVTSAVAEVSPQDGGWLVTIRFDDAGTQKWAALTEDVVGERVAFTIRGSVVSAPNVNEPILDGATQISGAFTRETAEDLVRQITGG